MDYVSLRDAWGSAAADGPEQEKPIKQKNRETRKPQNPEQREERYPRPRANGHWEVPRAHYPIQGYEDGYALYPYESHGINHFIGSPQPNPVGRRRIHNGYMQRPSMDVGNHHYNDLKQMFVFGMVGVFIMLAMDKVAKNSAN